MSELEDTMAEVLANEIQKEIDQSIMLDMLVSTGWTKVEFSAKDKDHATDIILWLGSHCKKNTWSRLGTCYVFKNKKDAEWFVLRWS